MEDWFPGSRTQVTVVDTGKEELLGVIVEGVSA